METSMKVAEAANGKSRSKAAAPASEKDLLVTKDGIKVAVGQVWRDLDKRMNGRTGKVFSVNPIRGTVTMIAAKATTLSVRRMHKHSTGWELVS